MKGLSDAAIRALGIMILDVLTRVVLRDTSCYDIGCVVMGDISHHDVGATPDASHGEPNGALVRRKYLGSTAHAKLKQMPLITYEIRWFLRDQPVPLEAVFGSDVEPESRTDWYAPVAHAGTGTKLREGRLETKLRTDAVETMDYAGCRGAVERWQKWSAELPESQPDDTLLMRNGWIPVHKERWMQVWSAEGKDVAAVTHRVGQGALFEVTRLTVADDTWWTIALEAFGPEGHRHPALERVTHHVLGQLPDHRRLSLTDSMGYPAWLMTM